MVAVDMAEKSQSHEGSGDKSGTRVNRRRLIQGLGVAAATGLAGCGGGGGNGDGGGSGGSGGGSSGGSGGGGSDLGERVPKVTMEYIAGSGGLSQFREDASPMISEDVNKAFGLDVEITSGDVATVINHAIEDTRDHHLGFWAHSLRPERLDPDGMIRRFAADWAGGNGESNPANYANCEYTYPAIMQRTAASPEDRREFVTQAQSVMSEDFGMIPIIPASTFGAARTDIVGLERVGDAGIVESSPFPYIASSHDADRPVVSATLPQTVQTTNFPIISNGDAQSVWNQLIHTPVLMYNENFELTPALAEDYTVENDFQKITINLRDGTFHNGDEITAEDVKFTYEQLANNPAAYPLATSPPYDSLTIVDDKTLEVTMTEPFPPFVTRVMALWGVFHKQTWVDNGAPDSPEDFQMDPIVGSGPYQVEEFSQGQNITLTPHDGHAKFDAQLDPLVFEVYRSQQSASQAFQQGEVAFMTRLTPGLYARVRDQMENGTVAEKRGYAPVTLYPQYNFGPTKFKEFRHAFGMAVNRKKYVDVAFQGAVNPEDTLVGIPQMPSHPWYPEDESQVTKFTDDPTGDKEGARQLLEEAGWGWDSDGNLHYPPDADLEPLWGEGEEPTNENFPCVTDGEFNTDYQP
jgi:peptide/nickel transport system substrate-binding protein